MDVKPQTSAFLSTPSARRATALGDLTVRVNGFLSTPSARRATVSSMTIGERVKISIHALREEGDQIQLQPFTALVISIHALREEGDP